jgi:hypothetical protein
MRITMILTLLVAAANVAQAGLIESCPSGAQNCGANVTETVSGNGVNVQYRSIFASKFDGPATFQYTQDYLTDGPLRA